MEWEQIELQSWDDFVLQVNRHLVSSQSYNDWFFRGQAKAEWTLKPSLLRCFENNKTEFFNIESALKIEEEILNNFKNQIHLYRSDLKNCEKWNKDKWWMLMQHYSCPTRILDWTLSPYIAAYFAVERMFDFPGAIWFFNVNHLNIALSKKFKTEYQIYGSHGYNLVHCMPKKTVFPCLSNFYTERLQAQQGVFTISNDIFMNHEEGILNLFLNYEENLLIQNSKFIPIKKIIIPSDLKTQFLFHLRLMNISANNLFPGLDGAGRSAEEFIKLRTKRESSLTEILSNLFKKKENVEN